jgi:hypothetical protein
MSERSETNVAVDRRVRRYHGCEVIAIRSHDEWHPYPWVFTVREPNGTIHQYGGIPNQCATAKAALRRGWWRAKWLAEGTYEQHYT